MRIQPGDKITFTPHAFIEVDGTKNTWAAACGLDTRVTGTVDYVHAAHGWFRVRYTVNGHILHECFKAAGTSGDSRYRFRKVK